jgi:serine/threonine protein kinase
MGLVLYGRRQKDNKRYALKTLKIWESSLFKQSERMDLFALPFRKLLEEAASFRRESLIWISLAKHKNVVQALWFDLDEHYHPFLVMELIEGSAHTGVTLRDWLHRKRTFAVPDAIQFILQALNGLIYARRTVNKELGLPFIHRDIKPENLLVAADGTLKVSDFGLVLAEGGGTPAYMPQEQWEGKALEEKTDVYALGCVLYEMIEGYIPFSGRTREELRHRHCHDSPQPLRRVPSKLGGAVMQCLAKFPEERPGFSILLEMLQDVHMGLTGVPVALIPEAENLDAEDLNARGAGFDELGFYDRAVACYTEAIALDSRDSRYYLNRANARIGLEDIEGVQHDYQKALELEPDALEAYLGQGSVAARRGDYEQAFEFFQKALTRSPQDPHVHVGLGNVLAQQGRFEEAKACFNVATAGSHAHPEACLGLGNVLLCQEDYPNAENMYKKAIAINPLYAPAYLNLARLYQIANLREKRDKSIILAHLAMA